MLVDENHPAFGAGFFVHLPQTMAVVEKLPEAFRTGVGLPYDAFGPEGAQGIERSFAPWFRALLVPFALPKLPGVVERLRDGGRVADVGCGAGVALLEMAKAFPKAELHGYEISQHALARAEQNRREAGVSNVQLPRRARRRPARGREPRLRHHLRLPARHVAPARGHARDPPRDPSATASG